MKQTTRRSENTRNLSHLARENIKAIIGGIGMGFVINIFAERQYNHSQNTIVPLVLGTYTGAIDFNHTHDKAISTKYGASIAFGTLIGEYLSEITKTLILPR